MFPLNSFARMFGFNKFFNAAILLTFFFVALNVVQAQVSTLEKSSPSAESAAPVKKTAVKKGLSAANGVNSRKSSAVRRDLQTVTFITAEPQSEIWLNDRILGQTNGEKKLTRKLVTGEYRVLVKKNNKILVPVQKITVSETSNVFDLTLPEKPPETAPQPENSTAAPVKETKPEIKPETPSTADAGEKAKKIIEDYQKPETTDQITAQDWETVYQAAQSGQFQNFTAVQVEAQRWFASGQLELAKNNYPNAVTAFTKSIEFMPQSGLPFYGLGNVYLADKKYADALKAFQTSLQMTPKFAPAYRRLGDAQRALKKDKEAAASYNTAIELGDKTVETRYGLAVLMLQTKRAEDAVKQLEEISKERQKPEVFTSLGDGYELLKRDVSAIPAYQKAIELDPNYAPAYFKLGGVYFDQHEYQKAKDAFQKTADLDPEGKVTNRSEVQKRLREATGKVK